MIDLAESEYPPAGTFYIHQIREFTLEEMHEYYPPRPICLKNHFTIAKFLEDIIVLNTNYVLKIASLEF